MSFIQNLFTSRDNSANSATYVGQQDRLWWDPVTNRFYVSDGVTPGGIPVGGGGGNVDLGNWAFAGNTQYNINGGSIDNSDLLHGPTAWLALPPNGSGNAVNFLNYYGNVAITAGTGPSNTKAWTFDRTGNTTTPGSLLPDANVAYDLGSPSQAWRSLYISGNTLYIANENMSVDSTTGVWNFTSNGANVVLGVESIFADITANNIAVNSVSALGNVTADYFVGNGSQLTGINVSTNKIFNGNSYANIAVPDGNVEINVNAQPWTFDNVGALNLPANGVVRNTTVNIVSDNFSQLQWVDAGNLNIPDPNSTGGITHWAYVGSDGFSVETNYNDPDGSHFWQFDTTGNLTSNGNLKLVTNSNLWNFDTNGTLTLPGNSLQLGLIAGNSGLKNLNSYDITIIADSNVWAFGTDGNLTLPGNNVSINYANGSPYGSGTGSGLPPQTGNVGKILSTDGVNPLWQTMPGVFGLVIDGGDAAFASTDFIIDGGPA